MVASLASREPTTDRTAPLPSIALEQRATVVLEETPITPVVSADGTVFQGPSGFLLEAPVASDELAYRLLDAPVKALIKGGPSGFDCAWLGLGQPGLLNALFSFLLPLSSPQG